MALLSALKRMHVGQGLWCLRFRSFPGTTRDEPGGATTTPHHLRSEDQREEGVLSESRDQGHLTGGWTKVGLPGGSCSCRIDRNYCWRNLPRQKAGERSTLVLPGSHLPVSSYRLNPAERLQTWGPGDLSLQRSAFLPLKRAWEGRGMRGTLMLKIIHCLPEIQIYLSVVCFIDGNVFYGSGTQSPDVQLVNLQGKGSVGPWSALMSCDGLGHLVMPLPAGQSPPHAGAAGTSPA